MTTKRVAVNQPTHAHVLRSITPALCQTLPQLVAVGYIPKWIESAGRWHEQRVSLELATLIDNVRRPDGMVTLPEAAALLGISRQAVKGLANRGKLEIHESAVDERAGGNTRVRSNGGGVPTLFVTRASVERYALEKATRQLCGIR